MFSLCRTLARQPCLSALAAFCHFGGLTPINAKPIDLSLYLIADRATVRSDEEFFTRIAGCIRAGVTCVQWRDPDADLESSITTVRRLQMILKEAEVSLVINSRFDVALATDPDAIFLESKRLSCSDARVALGENMPLSLPVETLEEVLAANEQNIDHISVKVFHSTCASTNITPVGIENLRLFRAAFHGKIIAVGGITLENIETVCRELNPGDGIAIRGPLLRAPDFEATAKKMRKVVDTIKGSKNK